jgi:hypothetical protein
MILKKAKFASFCIDVKSGLPKTEEQRVSENKLLRRIFELSERRQKGDLDNYVMNSFVI